MKSKIKSVPLYVWLVAIFSYITPIVFDTADGLYEMIWFVYLIPSFFFSYFFGLKGGIITALIATLLHVTKELKEYLTDQTYEMGNLGIMFSLTMISLVIAISFGILSDKLKKQQLQLEESNEKLEFLNKELKKLSLIDELTSLWNRRGFLSLVQNQMEKPSLTQMSIVFVDLDGFKAINDHLGHGIGDILLRVVGEKLRNCIREEDLASRIGGDEFVLMLSNADRISAEKVAQRIIQSFVQPFIIDGHAIFITASIGISLYPFHGKTIDRLIENADAAMYHAKKQGKNNFQFYCLT